MPLLLIVTDSYASVTCVNGPWWASGHEHDERLGHTPPPRTRQPRRARGDPFRDGAGDQRARAVRHLTDPRSRRAERLVVARSPSAPTRVVPLAPRRRTVPAVSTGRRPAPTKGREDLCPCPSRSVHAARRPR